MRPTADNTRTSWDAFLFELQGRVFELFPSEAPLLAELSGYSAASNAVDHHSAVKRIDSTMDGNRDTFSGSQVRHTVIPSGLQGGGVVSETGTWNVPIALAPSKIAIKLADVLVPFSVTVDVERDSFNNSNATAVATLTEQAMRAAGRLENLYMNGTGDGLQANITDSATSLTTTVATTSNWDVLLPGTVWDILTRSTGADPGQGLRRKIASVVESTGVITWSTTQQASDGGSGSIVHASTEGIYVPGSFTGGAFGAAPQGLEQFAVTSGTIETLAVAAPWLATDGRGGDTTSIPLSAQMLDGAVRRGRRAGLGTWDFGIGDAACIDLYKQGLYAQVRYDPQTSTLKSGFSGIVYDGADTPFPLIKEAMHKKGGIKLIDKASFQLYGDKPGPEFLQDDGSIYRRFSRNLAKEAEFLDRMNLLITSLNKLVYLNNLASAA